MYDVCTCGQRFTDPEDWRDHMPCPGTREERLAAENKRLRKQLKDKNK